MSYEDDQDEIQDLARDYNACCDKKRELSKKLEEREARIDRTLQMIRFARRRRAEVNLDTLEEWIGTLSGAVD